MFLGLIIAIFLAVLAVLCSIGAVIALAIRRPVISLLLFICFAGLLILSVGIGLLWVLWRIFLNAIGL